MNNAAHSLALLLNQGNTFNLITTHLGANVAQQLLERAQTKLAQAKPGDLPKWLQAIEALPRVASASDFSGAVLKLGPEPLPPNTSTGIETALRQLAPWRKGPFSVCGVPIDSEWRSDLKFDRILRHVDLVGRSILDVGCGNGYYSLRALGAGARLALGVDPTWLFVAQFAALSRFTGTAQVGVLPLTLEDLPEHMEPFDCVFSLGVLYHSRTPLDHLLRLRRYLKPQGKLVLETLITAGPTGYVLTPTERYACMRNVWSIPAPGTLLEWLERAGYQKARIVDVTPTSPEEQRASSWSSNHSLINCLDPDDFTKTIEGYPAPVRALAIAE